MSTIYKIKENKEGILKTVITEEVEIDLSNTLKNIRNTRLEFSKSRATILELMRAMDAYVKQHKSQNEFLAVVKEFLGEDYQLPELVNPFNAEDTLTELEKFTKQESERRQDNLDSFMKENEKTK